MDGLDESVRGKKSGRAQHCMEVETPAPRAFFSSRRTLACIQFL
jgi:hypothetical protein